MHGGLSTGPRTTEGLERSRTARWKHGRKSREAREHRRLIRALSKALRHRREALRTAADETRRAATRERAWDEVEQLRDAPAEIWAASQDCWRTLTRRGYEPLWSRPMGD